jgi:uncharacterized Zn finger protein (UPF0148 family)
MAELKCPNCGTVGIPGAGGKVTCATCGGTFSFVAGEAKLTDVGQLDKLQADVEELKQRLPASSPKAEWEMETVPGHPFGTLPHDHEDADEEDTDDEDV